MTVELAARVDGRADAPTLVLLSSIGATTAMWDACVPALSRTLRVVRLDTRGHGDSPRSPDQAVTVAELAGDVLAALDRLALDRVHVAGLSLGGMVGMWLAAHEPARVDRLALLCTSAYLPPAQGWLDRAATVRAGGMAAIADSVVARWITAPRAATDPALPAALRAMFTSVDAESYAQCCEAIAALDLRGALGGITAPTLVVAGAEDPATPPEHAALIADAIPGARLDLLSPAAHLATVEQPGAVAARLLSHFRTGERAAGFVTRRAVLGDEHVDRAILNTTEFTAPFQDFITRYAWGDVWSRPGLSRRERSVATLAALVALGAEHEIAMHVRAALRNGLSTDEIGEVLLHTAVYAGVPRANRAFAIANEVLAEAEPAGGIQDTDDDAGEAGEH